MADGESLDTNGWVVFLDVFAFSALISEGRPLPDILAQLKACHSEAARSLSGKAVRPSRFVFSDSTFLFYPVLDAHRRYDVLEQCVHDVEKMMSIFADRELPLRGGIAYGPVAYEQSLLLLGEPVVRAYRYEQLLPAPLVLLPARECTVTEGSDALDPAAPRCRRILLKDGDPMLAHLCLPFPIDGFPAFVDRLCRKYLTLGPPGVAARWEQAKSYIEKGIEGYEDD